ncbi:MAG TPA: DUF5615 family PIN-like protein [Flavobacteriales bacterium]|nr:DUF5615 family PIN-like protein [Flavobacteriales bacterium]
MRFLLDECVAKASAIRLRMVGHDVKRVGTDVRIPNDSDILQYASKEHRLLVTHDQDFGELVFKKRLKAPSGIVLFRYEPSHPEEVARRLIIILASGLCQFEGSLTAVDEDRVRQRRI